MSDCIEFYGDPDRKGRGRRMRWGKRFFAHRLAYADANSYNIYDLDGWVIRHTCDNPSCINPEHLLIGNDLNNIQDRQDRGRQAKAESHGSAKLNWEKVRDIRTSTLSRRELAKKYGVGKTTIGEIQRYENWIE